MAKFRYSMQSILDIKLKMENQARQEFSSAKAALDAEEEVLKALVQKKTDYEMTTRRLLEGDTEQGRIDLLAVKETKTAVYAMDDFIENQKVKVRAAENTLEEARSRLTELIMERKTHEKLKEKAFQQFLEDEKRQESKEVDELTSYVYGQKTREQDVVSSVPM